MNSYHNGASAPQKGGPIRHKGAYGRGRVIVPICSILSILIFVEVFVRFLGFGSFPLYDLDADMKYIPSANQHGAFLNRNDWFFNDRHMGNKTNWTPDTHPDVLLVGNSVVMGGLPYKHEEKLGPLLQKDLGPRYAVWSAAAGGWSNVNEIAYLEHNQDVVQNADVVVLEYMSSGLAMPSSWPGYYVFPDQRPSSVASYVFGKYVVPRIFGKLINDSGALPPTGEADPAQLRRFTALVASLASTRSLVIFMYPTKDELRNRVGWAAATAPIRETSCVDDRAICIDLAGQGAWTPDLYRNDGVHPNVAGNKVLAAILAAAINRGSLRAGR